MEVRGFPLKDIERLCAFHAHKLGVADKLEDAFHEAVMLILEAKQVPSWSYLHPIVQEACRRIYRQTFSVMSKKDLVGVYSLDASIENTEDLTYMDTLYYTVDFDEEIDLQKLTSLLDQVLTPREYTVIKGLFFEGKTYYELAKELNVSSQTVLTTRNTAFHKLRQAMTQEKPPIFAILKEIVKKYRLGLTDSEIELALKRAESPEVKRIRKILFEAVRDYDPRLLHEKELKLLWRHE